MIPYKLSIFHVDYTKKKTKELRLLHNLSWSIYFNNRIYGTPFGYCAFFDNKRISSSMRKFLLEMGYEEDVVVNKGFVVEIDKDLGFSNGTVVLSKGRKKYITKLDGGTFSRSFFDIFKESTGSIKNWKFSETVRVEVFHYSNHLSVGLVSEEKNCEKTRLFCLSKLSYKKPWKKELIPGHLHQTKTGEYLICLGHVSDVVIKSERGRFDAALSIYTHYSKFYQFFNRSSIYYGMHSFKKSKEDCAVCIQIPSEHCLFTDSNDFTRYSKSDGVLYLLDNLLLDNFSSLSIYPPSSVPNSIPLCKVCKPAKDFKSIFLDATSIHSNLIGDFTSILKIVLNPKMVSYIPEIKKAYLDEYERVCKNVIDLVISSSSSIPKVDPILNYLNGKSTAGVDILNEWESGLFVDPISNEDTKKFIQDYLATKTKKN